MSGKGRGQCDACGCRWYSQKGLPLQDKTWDWERLCPRTRPSFCSAQALASGDRLGLGTAWCGGHCPVECGRHFPFPSPAHQVALAFPRTGQGGRSHHCICCGEVLLLGRGLWPSVMHSIRRTQEGDAAEGMFPKGDRVDVGHPWASDRQWSEVLPLSVGDSDLGKI